MEKSGKVNLPAGVRYECVTPGPALFWKWNPRISSFLGGTATRITSAQSTEGSDSTLSSRYPCLVTCSSPRAVIAVAMVDVIFFPRLAALHRNCKVLSFRYCILVSSLAAIVCFSSTLDRLESPLRSNAELAVVCTAGS